MKISYITDNFTGTAGNGISAQAKTWADILKEYCAQEVELVNPWENHKWGRDNIVHLFGSTGVWFEHTARTLKENGCKLCWSPIYDNDEDAITQRLKTYIGAKKVGLFSYPYVRKTAYPLFDKIFVRSNYEMHSISTAYNVPLEKLALVPLSLSYGEFDSFSDKREKFCLHISSISQPRKNVIRLIEAAKKYQFKLVLAGNKGSVKDFQILANAIGYCSNIEVLGFISEEEKKNLYRKAKVFALPSINEGVGIVALDAAHFGCDVVITKRGGPHEYFQNLAKVVDPFNVDEIGQSICVMMEKTFQPSLKEHVEKFYSQRAIAERLLGEYRKFAL